MKIADTAAAVLIGISSICVALSGLQIWNEIKNDPPYPMWWEEKNDDKM